MRIPFNANLNVGCDIVDGRRLLKHLPHNHDHFRALARRFLHPSELEHLQARFPEITTLHRATLTRQKAIAHWLAGRWAAKEAAKKAWGADVLSFKDLRVESLPGGSVRIVAQSFLSSCEREHSFQNPSQEGRLSISHDGDYAVATVLAEPLDSRIISALRDSIKAATKSVTPPPGS